MSPPVPDRTHRPWLQSYEGGVAPNLRYPQQPLHAFLSQTAARYPDHACLIFHGERTYRETEEDANRLARRLIDAGVRKGDRVAIMLPNLPQCVIAYYGVLKTGAVAVQVNPLYVERELEEQLKDAGAETLIALDLFYPRIKNVIERTPLKRVLLTGVQDLLPWVLRMLYPIKARREGNWIHVEMRPPFHRFMDWLQHPDASDPRVPVVPDDLALLQYTGGTTGTPKGVMLTHRNLVVNAWQCRQWMPSLREAGEVFLAAIPFFHVYGMTTCMNLGIIVAASLVLVPRFSTAEVLKLIRRYQATIFPGVQAMYVAINNYKGVNPRDLSSVRICISGAGPLHAEVQDRFESLTGGKLVEGYGLTEAAPVTHANPIFGRRKKGSIGLPFPDTDAKIVDLETGQKDLPSGEVGELVIRGPQVMRGYWNKPEETANVLKEGWLCTGDIARMDEEGFFFIVDRKKDMIKTRGENVYPRDVEEALYRHPKVQDAVVVGVPEQFSVEIIKAYVVLKAGMEATEEEILSFCRQHLARFKVPKVIEFRKELPKTMVGKVLRRVLLEEELKKQVEPKASNKVEPKASNKKVETP